MLELILNESKSAKHTATHHTFHISISSLKLCLVILHKRGIWIYNFFFRAMAEIEWWHFNFFSTLLFVFNIFLCSPFDSWIPNNLRNSCSFSLNQKFLIDIECARDKSRKNIELWIGNEFCIAGDPARSSSPINNSLFSRFELISIDKSISTVNHPKHFNFQSFTSNFFSILCFYVLRFMEVWSTRNRRFISTKARVKNRRLRVLSQVEIRRRHHVFSTTWNTPTTIIMRTQQITTTTIITNHHWLRPRIVSTTRR